MELLEEMVERFRVLLHAYVLMLNRLRHNNELSKGRASPEFVWTE